MAVAHVAPDIKYAAKEGAFVEKKRPIIVLDFDRTEDRRSFPTKLLTAERTRLFHKAIAHNSTGTLKGCTKQGLPFCTGLG